MRLEAVRGMDSPHFAALWELYKSAFPPDERRDLEKQKALFGRAEYRLFTAVDEGEMVGLLSLWEFGDFVFIEHLAVKEESRGRGAGTAIVEGYLAGRKRRVLLEVEPPRTAIQKKRISFYQKLGFILNTYDYIQPPYGPGKKPVPLLLMSYPEAISETGFAEARRKIHTSVYGLEKPLE